MYEPTTPRQKDWIWIGGLVLVTLLALGLRWYYVSSAQVVSPVRADAAEYVHYAWNLAHRQAFSDSAPGVIEAIPSSYRDPGYPLLLAFWMQVFGNQGLWYTSVLLCQALLSTLTIPLAMLVGRRWLGRGWTIGAGVLMALWPHNIVMASDLLSETLFGFLCALAMWLCARACSRRSTGWAAAAGLGFGAAALTNAVLLPFGIILALFLAWRRLVPRHVWVALCLAAALLPGAWALRNLNLPTQASGQASIDRALQNLVQGSWPAYHTSYTELMHHNRHGLIVADGIRDEYQLLRTSPAAGSRAIAHRMSQQSLYYWLDWYVLHKPRVFWGWRIRVGENDIYTYPTVRSPFDTQPAMRALVAIAHTLNPVLALIALGFLVATLARRGLSPDLRAGDRAVAAAVLLLAVYVTVVYSILQVDPRYSIPFRSFEMLLAMSGCSVLAGWITRARTRWSPTAHEAGT